MNSEELELSLRTEFEEQLKSVFADMRQEMTQLQEKVEAEFEKHRSQMSDVFRDSSARIETEKGLDAGFSDSVIEHLRLARDEGARITATAIAEAEEMQREAAESAAQAEPSIGDLRDAINEISRQTSQSSILKTLVQHAAKFTTRGAFFIVKNEHFVGWRTFGRLLEEDDKVIREIFFPASSETVLGESVRSLSAVESSYGTYAGDSTYLDKLGFGQPEKMVAIPLIARGRGVAVLYADGGEENESVNVEALETLVRVAGLTVEVMASSPVGGAAPEAPPARSYSDSSASATPQKETDTFTSENNYPVDEKTSETGAPESFQSESRIDDAQNAANYNSSFDDSPESFTEINYQSPSEDFSYQSNSQIEPATQSFDSDDLGIEVVEDDQEANVPEHQHLDNEQETEAFDGQMQAAEGSYSWNTSSENSSPAMEDATESYQTSFQPALTEEDFAPATNDYHFEEDQYVNSQSFDKSPVRFEENTFDNSYESAAEPFVPQTPDGSFSKEESYGLPGAENRRTNDDYSTAAAQATNQPTATSPIKSRFSDRNVDLPIEVSEDERRLHNDARRFARLLVSEIKLYNEQKVKEGREARDLYERLREAIDRSREMYDKRVQPPVAAKFDYFHYELVSTLAEGDSAKLGGSYRGANV